MRTDWFASNAGRGARLVEVRLFVVGEANVRNRENERTRAPTSQGESL